MCDSGSLCLPVTPDSHRAVVNMVAPEDHIDCGMKFNTGNFRSAKLLHIIDMMNMIVLNDAEHTAHTITQNLLHDNYGPEDTPMAPGGMESQDIFIEVGHGPTLVDNNIMLSKAAIRLATQGVAVVHNLISYLPPESVQASSV